MNFQVFSDEFLEKWLTPYNLLSYKSINDRKLIAGTNWLSSIMKSSFKRYDDMWKEIYLKCDECMKNNCQTDYDWILGNSEIISNHHGFKKIKFADKEIGQEGFKYIYNYHKCKKNCYEKVNILNVTFLKKMKMLTGQLNSCILLCRGKPIEKETMLADCYSDCMIKTSYEIAKTEYYIKYVHEKLLDEYSAGNLNPDDIELIHAERFTEREFTPDKWKKYL